MRCRSVLTLFSFALAFLVPPSGAAATDPAAWPARPVRVIVPMATGGGSDTVARTMSHELSGRLGQQFVVDNRGGGGGLIGIGLAVKAMPDGYTIMLISGSVPATVAAHQPPYEVIGSLSGIIRVGYSPLVLVVHPSIPVATVEEFVAYARARPGKLSFVVPGVGSLTHLATEYLMRLTDLSMQHIPYKSTGLGMSDLLSGQVPVMMTGLSPVVPQLQSGKLRGIAVTTASRWPAQPNLPTISETIAGFEVESWFAFVAPKGTPAGIIDRLNAEMNEMLQNPQLRKLLDARGVAAAGGSAEDVDRRMRSEVERWSKIIREAGIRVNP